MKTIKGLLAVTFLSSTVGCSTLSPSQSVEYSEMERNGLLVEEKNPSTGAALGLLPGGGSFYGREPLVGVVDLLLWPISILWDPVVGYQTSKVVNYKVTLLSG